jgi:hypothetical protein
VDLFTAEVDGEIILMSVNRGYYYGLDGTAREIWELLETPLRFDELCRRLESKYTSSKEVIEEDTKRFLTELASETIVLLS